MRGVAKTFMKRKRGKYTKLFIVGKVPERSLTENDRLASAMGFIQVQFAPAKERVRWCDLTAEFLELL